MREELSLHYLHRIAEASEKSAAGSTHTRRELIKVRKEVEGMVAWIKRAALLVALYGTGITLLMLSQEKAQFLVDVIKTVR